MSELKTMLIRLTTISETSYYDNSEKKSILRNYICVFSMFALYFPLDWIQNQLWYTQGNGHVYVFESQCAPVNQLLRIGFVGVSVNCHKCRKTIMVKEITISLKWNGIVFVCTLFNSSSYASNNKNTSDFNQITTPLNRTP